MKLRQLSLLLILFACLCGMTCKQDADYHFFVAGHIYGTPGKTYAGPYPPFLEALDSLKQSGTFEFGVLTGDLVKNPTEVEWENLKNALAPYPFEWKTVYGNHDWGNKELAKKQYGPDYWQFRKGSDLFIGLNSNLDSWNVSDDQATFLINSLESNPKPRIVFLFVHHVIWAPGLPADEKLVCNWPPEQPDSTNFWSFVMPKLQALSVPVYCFSGDVGANHQASPLHLLKRENVHLIASGMGDSKGSNLIQVSVSGKQQELPKLKVRMLTKPFPVYPMSFK